MWPSGLCDLVWCSSWQSSLLEDIWARSWETLKSGVRETGSKWIKGRKREKDFCAIGMKWNRSSKTTAVMINGLDKVGHTKRFISLSYRYLSFTLLIYFSSLLLWMIYSNLFTHIWCLSPPLIVQEARCVLDTLPVHHSVTQEPTVKHTNWINKTLLIDHFFCIQMLHKVFKKVKNRIVKRDKLASFACSLIVRGFWSTWKD